MTRRETLAWISFATTAAALAVAVVLLLRQGAPAPPAPGADEHRFATVEQVARIEDRLGRIESDLRASVPPARTTAASDPGASTRTVAPSPDPAAPASASDSGADNSMEQSRLTASRIVDQAIQDGYWTRKDNEAWLAASAGMRVEDRFELHRRLIVELNAGRLRMEPGAWIR